MRLTLGWLQEFVSIEGPIDALAERLVLSGFEVASVAAVGAVDPQAYKRESCKSHHRIFKLQTEIGRAHV